MSSALNSVDLVNLGNILYLSNNITTLSSNLTIGTSPVANEQFYFLGNANITGNLFASSNLLIPYGSLSIGAKTSDANLHVTGNAFISSNLYIGDYNSNVWVKQPGIRLDIMNSNIYDTNINGSLNGNVLNQFSFGLRTWVFSQDSIDSTIIYLGSHGGGVPDADFEYMFKKNVGLQIQPRATGNTTDFIEALKVVGNANIIGNLVSFANVLIPNGNIGIGTNNPRYKLDVAGGANISLNTIMNANANVLGNLGISGNIIGTSNLILLNGNIGIGTVNPQYKLDVAGGANISGNLNFSGNLLQNGSPYIGSQWTTSAANIFYNTGNVGIGTSTPIYQLDVAGSSNVSVNSFVRNNLAVGTTTATANLTVSGNAVITGNLNVDNGLLWSDPINNRIGINNTNPQQTLDIAGSANISVNAFVRNNLAIGTSTATANLTVTGNARISSNVIIGPDLPFNLQNGTALAVRNTSAIDSNINGSLSGNVYHQMAMGGRNWVFSQDTSSDGYLFFGCQGGGDPDPELEYMFKRGVGLQIQPSPSIITTDFTEALKVLGTANITGNIVAFANVLIPNNNLGIGINNPQFKLDVNGSANISGNINFTGNLYQNGNLFTGGGGSQWTTGTANIYYTGGNVGIGTPSPIYRLDVAGDSNIGGNVYGNNFYIRNDCILQSGDFSILNGNLTVYEKFNAFGESYLSGNLTVYNSDIYNYGNIYTYNGLYINKNGALYNLNENPNQHAFYAYDTVNFMTTLYGGADDTNAVGYIGVGGYGGPLPLILNPIGGNVGIATGTPKAKLHVEGNAIINGNLNIQNGNLFMNRFGNLGLWTTSPMANLHVNGNAIITGNLNVDNGLLWTDPVTNRVGILNTNPQYELDVTGNINLSQNMILANNSSIWFGESPSDSSTQKLRFHLSTAASFIDYNSTSNGNLFIRYGSPTPVTRFTFDGINGRLGLGIQPTVQLDLSTDGARKLTNNTWSTGSDLRIKEDIVDANIDRCYEIISNIKLKHYKWIDEIANKVQDKSQLGWIAQEVEEYFPKAVTKSNEYGLSDFRTLNADQLYKVMYGALQKMIVKNNDLSNIVQQQNIQIQYLYQTLLPNIEVSNIVIPQIISQNNIIQNIDINTYANRNTNTSIWKIGSSKWDNLEWK